MPSGSVVMSIVDGSMESIRPISRFVLRRGQRLGGEIDAGRVQAETSRHQRVLTGTAACVQYPPADGAGFGESEERRLRSTDVPRRRSEVQILGSVR